MRIFVTGATGFVGSVVVTELLKAGHHVLGLARSDASAAMLMAVSADVLRGDLEDEDVLRHGAISTDGIIHAGFNHDFSKFVENCEIDRRAIEVMGNELRGTDRPFIVTAGLPLTPGHMATENDLVAVAAGGSPRRSEQAAVALIESGVKVSVIRVSQVHDRSKHGLASYMIAVAQEKGFSAYVGSGQYYWPAVHRLDAAKLYAQVLEKGVAGARYHAVAEEAVSVREIAKAIGEGLGIPVLSLSPGEAAAHFGWLAFPVSMDAPASSLQTQVRLDWHPFQNPSFMDDLRLSVEFHPR